jgi:hypothetical protein
MIKEKGSGGKKGNFLFALPLLSFIVLVQFSTQKIILTAIKRLGETYSA